MTRSTGNIFNEFNSSAHLHWPKGLGLTGSKLIVQKFHC